MSDEVEKNYVSFHVMSNMLKIVDDHLRWSKIQPIHSWVVLFVVRIHLPCKTIQRSRDPLGVLATQLCRLQDVRVPKRLYIRNTNER